MNATIEIDGLRKRFGPVRALDGMTFMVQPGRVTGFVGPNGAGKSTTMRVVVGLDAPDAGTATIGGRPYRSLQGPLTHVGSVLDAGALQPGRSARNHLLWLAHSQVLKAGRVDEVIALAGLESAARRKAGGYSLGMRQRLGIAAALLGDPPVLIFDEPFNGMDPEGIVWVKGFLRTLAAQDRAVLVSSHLMSELEDTAGHLVIVGRGRVIADTSVVGLIAAASGNRVTVRTTARVQAMTVLGSAGAEVAAAGPGALTISGLSAGKALAVLTEHAIPFSEVTAHRATLEQAYMELTRESGRRCGTRLGGGHRTGARRAVPVSGRRGPRFQCDDLPAPAADRPPACRPGRPGHDRGEQPAAHPVAGPRRGPNGRGVPGV
jgi:ABC-2 type transport system ATP-binding protein